MNSRLPLYLLILLVILALGGIWYFYTLPKHRDKQIFPATVNRDCAPWDGSAFTVFVRYDATTTITISIWKSPELKFPVMFSFPDKTGQVGIAYILPELDPLEELTGKVWLQRVGQGIPLVGRFRLTSVQGRVYEGRFVAEWASQVVYCG